ncbi:MAG: coat protein [Doliovirus lythtis]|uniref:Coat protein n=1 Tax=Circoviridae sp. TaxID=1954248 RepID=A0A345MQ99_9VIRU|nr:MAG: coat protein [Circoviridae sp.]
MPMKRTVTTVTRARPRKRRATAYSTSWNRFVTARGRMRTSGYYGRYAPLGTELKFLDTTATTNNVATTGVIHNASLNLIPQGVTESQRVGRKCTIKSLHLRWTAQLNDTGTATSTDDGVRILVYLDKQCNGATATVTDILESASYLSFNNLSNKNRFRVLMDKTCDISATAAISATFGQKGMTYQWHWRGNMPIEFSSTTGAITEIRSNNIGVLLVSDNARINVVSNCRVRFADN